MPNPWSNQLIALLIIAASISGFSGVFVYSPAPGAGNLIASLTATSGTDPYGNTYQAGLTVYGANNSYSQITSFTGPSGTVIPTIDEFTGDASQTSPARLISFVFGSGATRLLETRLLAGSLTTDTGPAQIAFLGTTADGVTADEKILFNVGSIQPIVEYDANFGVPNAVFNCTQNFTNPGSGPFITGEGFHSLTLPAGLTGFVRVKLVPWNGVWIDGNVSWTTTAATTFTFPGSLPSASYYPTSNRIFAMNQNGTPSGIASSMPRLFVPGTSGSPQIIVPSSSGGGTAGFSVTYPNN